MSHLRSFAPGDCATTVGRPRLLRGAQLLLAFGAVLALAALLAGAEVTLRLSDPGFFERREPSSVYSERYGWRYRPRFHGSEQPIRINARGYRGPERRLEKTPGRKRLVMLGDSILFGTGTVEDETFASLLESRTGRYEVVNLGVEGYGTDQELLVLEDEGLAYRPDVVVLDFCIDNDVANNGLAWDQYLGRLPKPYFTLEHGRLQLHDQHVRLTPVRRVAQWLEDWSQLYGRLRAVLPRRPQRPPPLHRLSRRDANQLTIRLVQHMNELTTAAGARFLVILHPNRPEVVYTSRLSRHLREAPELAGIPMLDLGERYRARGLGPDAVLRDYQGHLSPAGHQVTVQEIEAWLASLGV